jgi:uncharacterized protein (TIGR00255 family)
MAVYSMTGYASASTQAGESAGISVDIRSVNGRFLDLALRMPDELRHLEPALRDLVAGAVRRGKVEVRVNLAQESSNSCPTPAPEQLSRLLQLQMLVQDSLPQARGFSVNEVLGWCRGTAAVTGQDAPLLDAARRAVDGLREARGREGARLAAMLGDRLQRLRELAAQAAPLLPLVVQRQQSRFVERWRDALALVEGAASVPQDALHERALAEAAAFAIRIDVAEELSRLASHLDEIERLLAAGGDLGKRLEFLIQELQREANTLGSKSAALELTSIAVDMKVAIEQMREQVQNIE